MIASNDKQRLFSICVVVSDDLPLSDEASPPSDEDQLQDKARRLSTSVAGGLSGNDIVEEPKYLHVSEQLLVYKQTFI